jgi:hypothetical protein
MFDNWEVLLLILVLGVDRVLGILRDRGIDIHRLSHQINELHVWHAREDADGVKVWYIRPTLESAIEKLAENITAQTAILKEIHLEIRESQRRIDRLESAHYFGNRASNE